MECAIQREVAHDGFTVATHAVPTIVKTVETRTTITKRYNVPNVEYRLDLNDY